MLYIFCNLTLSFYKLRKNAIDHLNKRYLLLKLFIHSIFYLRLANKKFSTYQDTLIKE